MIKKEPPWPPGYGGGQGKEALLVVHRRRGGQLVGLVAQLLGHVGEEGADAGVLVVVALLAQLLPGGDQRRLGEVTDHLTQHAQDGVLDGAEGGEADVLLHVGVRLGLEVDDHGALGIALIAEVVAGAAHVVVQVDDERRQPVAERPEGVDLARFDLAPEPVVELEVARVGLRDQGAQLGDLAEHLGQLDGRLGVVVDHLVERHVRRQGRGELLDAVDLAALDQAVQVAELGQALEGVGEAHGDRDEQQVEATLDGPGRAFLEVVADDLDELVAAPHERGVDLGLVAGRGVRGRGTTGGGRGGGGGADCGFGRKGHWWTPIRTADC